MAERGPWSVKGIDQRARQAARDAARTEGITLGEYLNKLILEESRDGSPYPDPGALPNARDYRAGAATTLDQLARRVEAVEARSTLAITGIDQSVLGLLARLDKAEDGQSAIAGHVDTLIDELRETHAALSDKVRRLEEDDGSQRNLEALKSLEQALGKLASHVYEEGARTQEETDAIRGRVEAGFNELGGRVEDMETRVDSTLADAAQRVEKAVEAAELRAEGTAKHLSDRFSGLETRVSERLAGIEKAGERLDKVETDVSGAIGSMEQTLLRIQDRLNRAESTTDAALKSLESTFDSLDKRIEAVAAEAGPDAAGKLRAEIEQRFDGLAEELKSEIAAARSEMARQIAETASPDGVHALKETLDTMHARLETSETRNAEAFETIGDQVSRISESFDKRLQHLEERPQATGGQDMAHLTEEVGKVAEQLEARVRQSEDASARAIEQVGEQVAGVARRLQSRQDEAFSRLSAQVAETRTQTDTRLSDALASVSERLERLQSETGNQLSPVQRAIASLADRLEQLEGQARSASSGDDDDLLAALSASAAHTVPAGVANDEAGETAGDNESFEPGLPDWEMSATDESDEDYTLHSDAAAPTDDPYDPLADLTGWDESDDLGAGEVREGDIFDTEAKGAGDAGAGEPQANRRLPPAHLDLEREMPRAARDLDATTGLEEDLDASDYIARARRAAIGAAQANTNGAETDRPARRSRLPLYAAASVVVLTAAGATTFQALRGKQAPDRPVQAATSLAPAETTAATASAAFAETAESDESDSAPETASQAIETAEPDIESEVRSEAGGEETALTLAASTIAPEAIGEPETPPASEADTPKPLADIRIEPIPAPFTLETAAAAGDRIAQFQLGEERIDANDFAMGANLIRKAAEQGLPAAQYRLAKLHEKGLGVPRDLAAARTWTERAATGGNIKAMHDIAVFNADGEGGPQSYARSAEWFRKAAEYGVVDSQYNLGVLYQEGLGLSANAGEALFWFTVAAGRGDPGAPAMAAETRRRVSEQDADTILERARDWKAAEPDPAANGDFSTTGWQRYGTAHIRAVQNALNALGYEAGTPDGVLGPSTRAAIRTYQTDSGQAVTGTLTPELIANLNALSSGA